MIPAANSAATISSVSPAVYEMIIATAMKSTGTSSRKRGGAESSSTDTSANPLPPCDASR